MEFELAAWNLAFRPFFVEAGVRGQVEKLLYSMHWKTRVIHLAIPLLCCLLNREEQVYSFYVNCFDMLLKRKFAIKGKLMTRYLIDFISVIGSCEAFEVSNLS